MLLPEPAYRIGRHEVTRRRKGGGKRTFAMNPEKRTSRLPSIKYAPLKEPGCCSVVMSTTGNIMVGGWVRWGKPFPEVFAQLIPCKDAEDPMNDKDRVWR
jgi:hypothetical protein